MATMEEYALARDTIQNLEGLRRDCRRNAAGYKADIASGRVSPTQLAVIMNQDAGEYLRRLDWQDRLQADGLLRQRLSNGLAVLQIAPADILSVLGELRQAAETLRDTSKGNKPQIVVAADALLASVVPHDTVWP